MISALRLSAIIFGTSVSCLSVTSPARGSELDTSRETTIVWSSNRNINSTDPANFNLYLINDDRLPSVSIEIASNVSTTAGSYSFDGVDVVPSSGFRFVIKDTSNNDLLVQSDTFSIVAKGDDTTTVTSGTSKSATSTTAYPESSSTTATTTTLNTSRTSSSSGSSPTSHSMGTVSQIPSSAGITGLVVLICASIL